MPVARLSEARVQRSWNSRNKARCYQPDGNPKHENEHRCVLGAPASRRLLAPPKAEPTAGETGALQVRPFDGHVELRSFISGVRARLRIYRHQDLNRCGRCCQCCFPPLMRTRTATGRLVLAEVVSVVSRHHTIACRRNMKTWRFRRRQQRLVLDTSVVELNKLRVMLGRGPCRRVRVAESFNS